MSNYKERYFWVGGKHACLEILNNSKRKVKQIICTENFASKNKINQKFSISEKDMLDKKFNDRSFIHQGIAVQTNSIETYLIKKINLNLEKSNILILNNISDQRNLGSIIRTSLAFKIDYVLIDKRYFNQESFYFLKSASGSFENQKIILTSNIKNDIQVLKKNNYWIYALDVKGQEFAHEIEFEKKIAFVIGSEDKGISKTVLEKCDQKIKIKINNKIESLNVSNAVTSLLTILSIKN